ncbi:hypothetical protein EJ04DRAFT_512139 [Polyplosphaeria fusca]|uniref:Uncharacterized protein n=1 Tax=Polyplosphaeria fusca TaxID=682080 RepID=A0A9P4QYW1_9PLEO|nr:hypothetical protein EJ04DRAFT_512139 [Polyplosphaeria fusca]
MGPHAKTPLLPRTEHDDPMPRRRPSSKRFTTHAALFIAVFSLFWLSSRIWTCNDPSHHHGEEDTKVPLEVHIMSKCPDARDCLTNFVVPAMANVSDKVDFRLSFIGKYVSPAFPCRGWSRAGCGYWAMLGVHIYPCWTDPSSIEVALLTSASRTTDEDDGVQCMHGQTECLGNIMMLCAASVYPDPKIYLGYSMCLIKQYQKIPDQEFLEDCALEHGIDFDKLNHCVSRDDGAYAMGMLRDSVQRSADLNVTTSCTVRLDNKVRCIFDSGSSECDDGDKPKDLVKDINELYDKSRGWTE